MSPNNNSFLPLVALGVVSALAFGISWRAMNNDAQGMGGPAITGGIFPKTEKFIPSPSAENLGIANSISVLNESPMRGFTSRQQSVGFEQYPWEEVGIVLEDHEALTAAVARGMAEVLSKQFAHPSLPWNPKRYPVILMVPEKGKPLPMGMSRLIRIKSKANAVTKPGESLKATIWVTMEDGRPRDWESVPQLHPAPGVSNVALKIEHTSQAVASIERLNWASWYAGLGRHTGGDVVAALTGGVVPLETDQLSLTDLHGVWAEPIAQHPDHEVSRWMGSWQDPLVRGWRGLVVGTKNFDRQGNEVATRDIIGKILDRGLWKTDGALAKDDVLLYKREGVELNRLVMINETWGQRLAVMQVASDAAARHSGWLKAAQNGERSARIQLRKHLLCEDLPGSQQREAETILRANANAKELALLGMRASATDTEKNVRDWSNYFYRAGDKPTSIAGFINFGKWDGEPALVQLGDTPAYIQSDEHFWQVDYIANGTFRRVINEVGTAMDINGTRVNFADGALTLVQ